MNFLRSSVTTVALFLAFKSMGYAQYCAKFGVIGQKELAKTAVIGEISTVTAVISFLKEDTGWTKRVGKIA